MAAVAFQRCDSLGSRVPIAETPFTIGAAPSCGLVLHSERIALNHARVRYFNGEYMISAKDDAPLYVNDERVPLMALRDGDEICLVDPGRLRAERFVFRNWLEDAFVPPGASIAQCWWGHPASADPANGPDRFGPGVALGSRPRERCRRVEVGADHTVLVVKTFPSVRDAEAGDRLLRTLSRAAGAQHPALATIVDGGLATRDGAPYGWMATEWVDGTPATEVVAAGGLRASQVVAIMRDIASALSHLHSRRLVHRDVAPGNVVVREDGGAAMIDFGHMLPMDEGAPVSPGVIGTPGYVAPEEVVEGGAAITSAVDIYGLCAVGYALFERPAAAEGGDVLETLSQATRPAPSPRQMGIPAPESLETFLMQGLNPSARARPTVEMARRMLDFAEAELRI